MVGGSFLCFATFVLLNFIEVYYPLVPIFFSLGDQYHLMSLLLFGSILGGEGEEKGSKWPICRIKLCPKPQIILVSQHSGLTYLEMTTTNWPYPHAS